MFPTQPLAINHFPSVCQEYRTGTNGCVLEVEIQISRLPRYRVKIPGSPLPLLLVADRAPQRGRRALHHFQTDPRQRDGHCRAGGHDGGGGGLVLHGPAERQDSLGEGRSGGALHRQVPKHGLTI